MLRLGYSPISPRGGRLWGSPSVLHRWFHSVPTNCCISYKV